jgi:hypothetical protein
MGKVLELQRELWERVAKQARRLGTAGKPSLERVVQAFEASFPAAYRSIDKDRFAERLRRSPRILLGDYHTLPRAQLAAAHLVKTVVPKYVALEAVPVSEQPTLDTWLASDLPASVLLNALRFEKHWGRVPLRGYEALLEASREAKCRLMAIDHPKSGQEEGPDFDEREAFMVDALRGIDGQCLALIGDLHLHPRRIPQRLGGNDCVVVHQNYAPYHFALQEAGETLPAILQIEPDRYVYQHTHPLLVEESCLVALAGEEETHTTSPEEWLPSMLNQVSGLLQVDCPDPPTVLATFEPVHRDLLTMLVPSKREMTVLLDRLFLHGMSFLPGNGTLILHLPGSNHLAEACGKWLAIKRAPLPPHSAPLAVRFLADVRLEAAGFLASLLVNPLRRGKDVQWYSDFLEVRLRLARVQASCDTVQAVQRRGGVAGARPAAPRVAGRVDRDAHRRAEPRPPALQPADAGRHAPPGRARRARHAAGEARARRAGAHRPARRRWRPPEVARPRSDDGLRMPRCRDMLAA